MKSVNLDEQDRGCRYLVVQIHPTAHPEDNAVQSNALARKGVLLPMSADGFYASLDDADGVAKWLREEHPTIDAYVTEVISKNGQRRKAYPPEHPPIPHKEPHQMTEYRPIAIPGMTDPIGIADQPSPMLQWVEIAAMVIDDQYQRPINHGGWRTVKSIAANFRWSCFTPVLLAPIEGGKFAVIDGQHRVHAALLCGIKSVPAMVVPIAATEQAMAFVQVNTARTAMSAFNLFKAGLAAGEEWAIKADKAVADAGCKLMRFHPSSKNKKAGEVYCVGLIRGLVTKGHDRAVTVTLTAICAIDGGGPMAVALYSEFLLKPLMSAVADFPEMDADQLVAVLRRHRPFNVVEAAHRLAEVEHRARGTAARDAFKTLIGSHLRAVAA